MSHVNKCIFCDIAENATTPLLFEDRFTVAFLDQRPLFPGHSLLIPRDHVETISDLPEDVVSTFFINVQKIERAVRKGMEASGSFVAINNKISQSVPHLHVHIVPRNKNDGLRGFLLA